MYRRLEFLVSLGSEVSSIRNIFGREGHNFSSMCSEFKPCFIVLDLSWWLVHVASRIRLVSEFMLHVRPLFGLQIADGFVCQELTIVWLYLTSIKSYIWFCSPSTIYTWF